MEKTQEQTPKPNPRQETKEEKIERLKNEAMAWISISKGDLMALGNIYDSDEEIEKRIRIAGNQAQEHDRWVLQIRKEIRFLKSELEKILEILKEGKDEDWLMGDDLEKELEAKINNLYHH